MNLHLCKKVLDAEQIRQADQFTIKNEPVSSIHLMERASEAFVEKFLTLFPVDRTIVAFCGVGNNGGDGLVVARLLMEHEYKVKVYVVGNEKKGTREFKINKQFIDAFAGVRSIRSTEDFPQLTKDLVIIDAIFGSGMNRPVDGTYGKLIDYINHSTCKSIVAVDIASGLGCDQKFKDGKVLNVAHTITFQVPKLSLMLPQNMKQSGEVHVVDIGLNQDFISSLTTSQFLVTPEFVSNILRPRGKYLHKGDFGRNLIIAGSRGKMGAAVLAAKACLKSGAGLLTTFIPGHGNQIMLSNLPEAMVVESSNQDFIENLPDIEPYHAIGVGPGIGQCNETKKVFEQLLRKTDMPLVIDADGLNILSEHPEWQELIPEDSVLTPHPGEFRRLVGDWQDDYERLDLQIALSKKLKAVVMLKGAHTSITTPRGLVFFNPTGNPGMATAGSGDVLTGIMTSLLGQGYGSIDAALLGAYLHGLAGDFYANKNSQESLIASDIIDSLSAAFREVRHSKGKEPY